MIRAWTAYRQQEGEDTIQRGMEDLITAMKVTRESIGYDSKMSGGKRSAVCF